MGPDGKGTAQAAVYIDGQPVQYAGEITLPEREERPAPPLLASMGFTMEQANEAASYLAEAFRVFCEQLEEAARAVADAWEAIKAAAEFHKALLWAEAANRRPLPPHQKEADPQEVRQADPGLVSGGDPVMLRLKANKTALYKLVADYVDNLPPMRSGTEFIKYSRTPDYALNWITPEWNTANAFFSTCMGHSLLSIEIRDGETGKTASRTTYSLTLRDLWERGMVKEFVTAAERRRIDRRAMWRTKENR